MKFEQPNWYNQSLYTMADEALIEKAEDAVYRICQLEKNPDPIIRSEQVWEGGDGENPRPFNQDPLDGSILFEAVEKMFYLWYRPHNRLINANVNHATGTMARGEGSHTCLAVSKDGITWEKRRVGRVRFNLNYDNNMINIIQGNMQQDHLSGVLPNFLPGREGQLVGTFFSKFDDPIYPMGITQLYSENGIDWKAHLPPTLPLDGDAHCLMWDPRLECYLCTTRSWVHGQEVRDMQLKGFHQIRNKRHIAIAGSRDLVHWTPMRCVLEADEQDPANAQLYYMYIIPYGHGYVGLLQMFYMDEEHMTYGPLDMQLVFSRNLVDWQRVGDRTPIIPRGPKDSWDQSHISVLTNPPFPEGEQRMRLWYGGKDSEHWQAGYNGLGTGTLRRDGFACWESKGDNEARLTTVPVKLSWALSGLFVNVDASVGELRVEIVDADTLEPLDGTSYEDSQPITGDQMRAIVCFSERRGNFIRHDGNIRLRFYLRNAKFYSFIAENTIIADECDNKKLSPWS